MKLFLTGNTSGNIRLFTSSSWKKTEAFPARKINSLRLVLYSEVGGGGVGDEVMLKLKSEDSTKVDTALEGKHSTKKVTQCWKVNTAQRK
jgi:hypothetical protein